MASESASDPKVPQPPDQDPGYARVRDYLLFGLSLPERALRSASGVVAGTVRESAALLLPKAFRNSRTYAVMIQHTLDFLAEDVGGVERRHETAGPAQVENYVARKAVGSFVDMAALATLHVSPMMLLAIVSDVAYGSQAYLRELAAELKKRNVIDQESTIDHVDDLLAAVAKTAHATSGTLDVPPISVEGLKRSIDETRAEVGKLDPAKILPQAEVQRLWDDIHAIATREGVNPLAVSGAVTLYALDKIAHLGRGALSTAVAAGTLLDRHVLEHYVAGLSRIRQQGFYRTLAETGRPYVEAVWKNFSAKRTTVTQELLTGRLLGRAWRALRRWLGAGRQAKQAP
jgi:hypothetical protein